MSFFTILLDIDWNFLDETLWGEPLRQYLLAAIIVIGALLLKKPLANGLSRLGYLVIKRFGNEQHGQLFRAQIRRPLELLISTILVFLAFQQLHDLLERFIVRRAKEESSALTIRFGDVTDHVFLFLTIAFSAWTVSRIVDYIYYVQREDAQRDGDKSRQQLLPLMKELFKLFVWATAFFWALGAVFHVNIPALITGVGIGGVAIALAAKESVENLFAAFTILTDKPFQANDVIRLGTLEGTVERIGFRSTRLRHADGSAFIIPNRKLVMENLENLTNRDMRRVRLTIQIKYGLSSEKLEKLISGIKTALKNIAHISDPLSVSVDAFNENAFLLLVSYHLPHPMQESNPDAIKQEVNFAIYRLLTEATSPDAVTVTESTSAEPEPEPETEEDSDADSQDRENNERPII